MPTISLRRFSTPDSLKHIREQYLIELLSPHEAFLKKRNFFLPPMDKKNTLDYDALAKIFLKPDTDMPSQLIDALFYIDEMSSKEMMDKLIEAAEKRGINLTLEAEVEPADVAVQIWLLHPNLLKEIHTE